MTHPPSDHLRRLSELVERPGVSLPWSYRPCKHDDWGYIRGPEKIRDSFGPYQPVVAISRQSDVTELDMAVHREAKTDPYEPVGRLIVEAVNSLPQLLARITALEAEREGLRAVLEKIRMLPGEINPSNYDHDDVCYLNAQFVETYKLADEALGQSGSEVGGE